MTPELAAQLLPFRWQEEPGDLSDSYLSQLAAGPEECWAKTSRSNAEQPRLTMVRRRLRG
jgi:hypothetical protein